MRMQEEDPEKTAGTFARKAQRRLMEIMRKGKRSELKKHGNCEGFSTKMHPIAQNR